MLRVACSLIDLFRELPVLAAAAGPFLAAHGLTWATIDAQVNIRAWQNSLISIALLSRKYKVRDPITWRRSWPWTSHQ